MRYFYVRVKAGNSNSLFNIYYNSVSTGTIASVVQLPAFIPFPAVNVSYEQLTSRNGVLVEVPDNASSIIVKDSSAICTEITKILEVYATITKTDVTISNEKNGTITVSTPAGGVPPYQVKLDDYPYESLETSVSYTGLSGGEYFVYVKDSVGNETVSTIIIEEPEPSTCSIEIVTEANLNIANGYILLKSTGGSWPKTYRLYKDTSFPYSDACGDFLVNTYTDITEQDSTVDVTSLSCGYYCLEVTSADGGVTISGTVNICPRQPQNITYPISVKVGSTINQACGGSGGTLTIYSLLPSNNGLVAGYQYFDEFGSPIYGPDYNYWSYPENCNVGTIDNFGYYSHVQNCSPCI